MKTVTLSLLAAMALLPLPGLAQSNEAETLNSILAEVRALHADVRLSQSSQILLAELQLQQSSVNAAVQRRDSAREKLNQTQSQEKFLTVNIARLENPNSEPTLDPIRKKQLTDELDRFKAQLATYKSQEVQVANDLQDAETRFSGEKRKLDAIQSQLDDLMKKLQP
ncbi:MAG TPA: hypothetical protein VGU46_09545 [Acidobacteriaceae bacterium]|nr:hypothetical protein [Acidobacteriaceae bacterium]